MSKFGMLYIGMSIFCFSAVAQSNFALMGAIHGDNNQTLSGASVFLYPIERGVISDAQGRFAIKGLEIGTYRIEVSYLGFKTLVDTVILDGNKTLKIRLTVASLSLQEVIVSENYAQTRQREEPLNIEIVNDKYIKQYLGGSLMKSIERLPGVSSIDIGSGHSKPVIRGLGFNRVVVVENGIKHEGQQWGADHGLEIDQYTVDYIEVVKGPASLMYGSDAIGGVIELINNNIPTDHTIGGSIDIMGSSNNHLLGTSVSLSGRKDCLFADFQATIIDYGDYKVPADSVDIYSYRAPLFKNHLRNTAGNEQNLHFTFGVLKHKFNSKVYISNVHSKGGFFANAHGLEPRRVDTGLHDKSSRDINFPYQEVNHFKVINKNQLSRKNYTIQTDFGYQHNFRQEWSPYVSHGYMPAQFPSTLGFEADLERQFDKHVYSCHVKLSYFNKERSTVVIGFNGDYQDNSIGGRGFIIPAFKQLNAGSYAYVKHAFTTKSLVQLGLRYDYGYINTFSFNDWFPSPVFNNTDTTWLYLQRASDILRSFSNISWSIGYVHKAENVLYKVNIGKGFRMPIAKELAANGVNYHHFSYEVGSPSLLPEISYQIDAGLEYSSDEFAVGATPFLNYFSNYIYLNPTSEHDRLYGHGNQVYYYTQSEVFRYGGEIHAHYKLCKPLQLGIIAEYVYSEQLSGEKKGFTLPFSPPASAIFNVKYQYQRVKKLENVFFSVDFQVSAPQNNIVPPEETTDGYLVMNFGLVGEVKVKKQIVSISLQVQNLLNNKYFNHTSYYRLVNVPAPGRSFVLNLSIPLSMKFNKDKSS